MPVAPNPVSEDWQLTEEGAKPASLLVQLRHEVYVLPWFRLVYVQGDDSEVEMVFASHLVTVTGHGLSTLVSAIASAASSSRRRTKPGSVSAAWTPVGTPVPASHRSQFRNSSSPY
jgi:hypothetical protein